MSIPPSCSEEAVRYFVAAHNPDPPAVHELPNWKHP